MEAIVGLLIITYDFPSAENLKDKRRVLRSLLDRARRERKVSISEVGFQNRIRSGVVAAALIGPNRRTVERECAILERMLCSSPEAEAVEVAWEWL